MISAIETIANKLPDTWTIHRSWTSEVVCSKKARIVAIHFGTFRILREEIEMFNSSKRKTDVDDEAESSQRYSSTNQHRKKLRSFRNNDDSTTSSFNSPGSSSAWDVAADNAHTNIVKRTMDSTEFQMRCRRLLRGNISILSVWFRQCVNEHNDLYQGESLEARVRDANSLDGANYIDRPVFRLMDLSSEYLRHQQFIKKLYGCSIQDDVDDSDDGGGELVCFGSDDLSQVGYPHPRLSNPASSSTQLSHGNNDVDNGSDDGKLPVVPPFLKQITAKNKSTISFRSLSAGGALSVALSVDGNPYTWGSNDDGSLGRLVKSSDDEDEQRNERLMVSEMATEDIMTEDDPGIVKGFRTYPDGINEDGTIILTAAGDSHILFLSLSGNVYQCGMYKDMDSGKFSDPGDEKSSSVLGVNATPVHIHRIKKPCIGIYTRGSFNAALLDDYSIVTWGFGNMGELARSANMTKPTLEKGQEVYDLTKSYFYYDDKDEDGKTETKPNLDIIYEQFFNPLPPIWPRDIPSRQQVISVATGAFHILVAARDPGSFRSRVFSSGLNNYGQLGLGDIYVNRHQLTLIPDLAEKNISKVAAGQHHSLALNLHGTELFSFGRSDYGQLGTGKKNYGEYMTRPALVHFPEKSSTGEATSTSCNINPIIVDICCGDLHSIALTIEHDLYTWGFNETGATGHESKDDNDVYYPTLLSLDSIGTDRIPYCVPYEIAGGGQHSMLLVKRFRS